MSDFHNHTQFSVDAAGTPENTVEVAKDLGLAAISITEHNSIGSTNLGLTAARKLGVRYIPGLELDLRWGPDQTPAHFLCFWFDPEHSGLSELVRTSNRVYDDQFQCLLSDIEAAGEEVDMVDFESHLAEVRPLNLQASLWSLRSYWIDKGFVAGGVEGREKLAAIQKTPVPSQFPLIDDVLPIIRDAGGILLAAHPGPRENSEEKLRFLLDGELIDGFEIYHKNNGEDFEPLLALRSEYACAMSGGSDCHDVREGSAFGTFPAVPASVLDTMEDKYREIFSADPPN